MHLAALLVHAHAEPDLLGTDEDRLFDGRDPAPQLAREIGPMPHRPAFRRSPFGAGGEADERAASGAGTGAELRPREPLAAARAQRRRQLEARYPGLGGRHPHRRAGARGSPRPAAGGRAAGRPPGRAAGRGSRRGSRSAARCRRAPAARRRGTSWAGSRLRRSRRAVRRSRALGASAASVTSSGPFSSVAATPGNSASSGCNGRRASAVSSRPLAARARKTGSAMTQSPTQLGATTRVRVIPRPASSGRAARARARVARGRAPRGWRGSAARA